MEAAACVKAAPRPAAEGEAGVAVYMQMTILSHGFMTTTSRISDEELMYRPVGGVAFHVFGFIK